MIFKEIITMFYKRSKISLSYIKDIEGYSKNLKDLRTSPSLRTFWMVMSQLLMPPSSASRWSTRHTLRGVFSWMAHCFSPPGVFHRQKNHLMHVGDGSLAVSQSF